MNHKNIERYADLLDTKFVIPGTKIRFGLDFLIGLIPGAGDVFSFVLSGGLLAAMVAKGASGKSVALMIINILLDAIIGGIPIIGDIFDLFFKANKRNLDLFQDHFQDGKYEGSSKPIIIGIFIFLLILLMVILYFFYWIIHLILN